MSLFIKIFALIFLAELGDKTQLAVMAGAASQPQARLTILVAASIALVASTLVAVFCGEYITRWIPEKIIQIAAALLFILFGTVLLHRALVPAAAPAVIDIPEAFPSVGAVGRRIIREAIELERLAFEDYRALAARVEDVNLQQLLQGLADEEEIHRQLLLATDRSAPHDFAPAASLEQLPPAEKIAHNVAASDKPILKHALEHERGTAAFYRQLARISLTPSLRMAFLGLAAAEDSHIRRLQGYMRINGTDV